MKQVLTRLQQASSFKEQVKQLAEDKVADCYILQGCMAANTFSEQIASAYIATDVVGEFPPLSLEQCLHNGKATTLSGFLDEIEEKHKQAVCSSLLMQNIAVKLPDADVALQAFQLLDKEQDYGQEEVRREAIECLVKLYPNSGDAFEDMLPKEGVSRLRDIEVNEDGATWGQTFLSTVFEQVSGITEATEIFEGVLNEFNLGVSDQKDEVMIALQPLCLTQYSKDKIELLLQGEDNNHLPHSTVAANIKDIITQDYKEHFYAYMHLPSLRQLQEIKTAAGEEKLTDPAFFHHFNLAYSQERTKEFKATRDKEKPTLRDGRKVYTTMKEANTKNGVEGIYKPFYQDGTTLEQGELPILERGDISKIKDTITARNDLGFQTYAAQTIGQKVIQKANKQPLYISYNEQQDASVQQHTGKVDYALQPTLLQQAMEKIIAEQGKTEPARKSGTAAVAAMISQEGVTVASIGDSSIRVAYKTADGFKVRTVTAHHRIENPLEMVATVANGGIPTDEGGTWYIRTKSKCNLASSSAIGDLYDDDDGSAPVISQKPDIWQFDFNNANLPDREDGGQIFVIGQSDGADRLLDSDVEKILNAAEVRDLNPAEVMMATTFGYGGSDNITVEMREVNDAPSLMIVTDGHTLPDIAHSEYEYGRTLAEAVTTGLAQEIQQQIEARKERETPELREARDVLNMARRIIKSEGKEAGAAKINGCTNPIVLSDEQSQEQLQEIIRVLAEARRLQLDTGGEQTAVTISIMPTEEARSDTTPLPLGQVIVTADGEVQGYYGRGHSQSLKIENTTYIENGADYTEDAIAAMWPAVFETVNGRVGVSPPPLYVIQTTGDLNRAGTVILPPLENSVTPVRKDLKEHLQTLEPGVHPFAVEVDDHFTMLLLDNRDNENVSLTYVDSQVGNKYVPLPQNVVEVLNEVYPGHGDIATPAHVNQQVAADCALHVCINAAARLSKQSFEDVAKFHDSQNREGQNLRMMLQKVGGAFEQDALKRAKAGGVVLLEEQKLNARRDEAAKGLAQVWLGVFGEGKEKADQQDRRFKDAIRELTDNPDVEEHITTFMVTGNDKDAKAIFNTIPAEQIGDFQAKFTQAITQHAAEQQHLPAFKAFIWDSGVAAQIEDFADRGDTYDNIAALVNKKAGGITENTPDAIHQRAVLHAIAGVAEHSDRDNSDRDNIAKDFKTYYERMVQSDVIDFAIERLGEEEQYDVLRAAAAFEICNNGCYDDADNEEARLKNDVIRAAAEEASLPTIVNITNDQLTEEPSVAYVEVLFEIAENTTPQLEKLTAVKRGILALPEGTANKQKVLDLIAAAREAEKTDNEGDKIRTIGELTTALGEMGDSVSHLFDMIRPDPQQQPEVQDPNAWLRHRLENVRKKVTEICEGNGLGVAALEAIEGAIGKIGQEQYVLYETAVIEQLERLKEAVKDREPFGAEARVIGLQAIMNASSSEEYGQKLAEYNKTLEAIPKAEFLWKVCAQLKQAVPALNLEVDRANPHQDPKGYIRSTIDELNRVKDEEGFGTIPALQQRQIRALCHMAANPNVDWNETTYQRLQASGPSAQIPVVNQLLVEKMQESGVVVENGEDKEGNKITVLRALANAKSVSIDNPSVDVVIASANATIEGMRNKKLYSEPVYTAAHGIRACAILVQNHQDATKEAIDAIYAHAQSEAAKAAQLFAGLIGKVNNVQDSDNRNLINTDPTAYRQQVGQALLDVESNVPEVIVLQQQVQIWTKADELADSVASGRLSLKNATNGLGCEQEVANILTAISAPAENMTAYKQAVLLPLKVLYEKAGTFPNVHDKVRVLAHCLALDEVRKDGLKPQELYEDKITRLYKQEYIKLLVPAELGLDMQKSIREQLAAIQSSEDRLPQHKAIAEALQEFLASTEASPTAYDTAQRKIQQAQAPAVNNPPPARTSSLYQDQALSTLITNPSASRGKIHDACEKLNHAENHGIKPQITALREAVGKHNALSKEEYQRGVRQAVAGVVAAARGRNFRGSVQDRINIVAAAKAIENCTERNPDADLKTLYGDHSQIHAENEEYRALVLNYIDPEGKTNIGKVALEETDHQGNILSGEQRKKQSTTIIAKAKELQNNAPLPLQERLTIILDDSKNYDDKEDALIQLNEAELSRLDFILREVTEIETGGRPPSPFSVTSSTDTQPIEEEKALVVIEAARENLRKPFCNAVTIHHGREAIVTSLQEMQATANTEDAARIGQLSAMVTAPISEQGRLEEAYVKAKPAVEPVQPIRQKLVVQKPTQENHSRTQGSNLRTIFNRTGRRLSQYSVIPVVDTVSSSTADREGNHPNTTLPTRTNSSSTVVSNNSQQTASEYSDDNDILLQNLLIKPTSNKAVERVELDKRLNVVREQIEGLTQSLKDSGHFSLVESEIKAVNDRLEDYKQNLEKTTSKKLQRHLTDLQVALDNQNLFLQAAVPEKLAPMLQYDNLNPDLVAVECTRKLKDVAAITEQQKSLPYVEQKLKGVYKSLSGEQRQVVDVEWKALQKQIKDVKTEPYTTKTIDRNVLPQIGAFANSVGRVSPGRAVLVGDLLTIANPINTDKKLQECEKNNYQTKEAALFHTPGITEGYNPSVARMVRESGITTLLGDRNTDAYRYLQLGGRSPAPMLVDYRDINLPPANYVGAVQHYANAVEHATDNPRIFAASFAIVQCANGSNDKEVEGIYRAAYGEAVKRAFIRDKADALRGISSVGGAYSAAIGRINFDSPPSGTDTAFRALQQIASQPARPGSDYDTLTRELEKTYQLITIIEGRKGMPKLAWGTGSAGADAVNKLLGDGSTTTTLSSSHPKGKLIEAFEASPVGGQLIGNGQSAGFPAYEQELFKFFKQVTHGKGDYEGVNQQDYKWVELELEARVLSAEVNLVNAHTRVKSGAWDRSVAKDRVALIEGDHHEEVSGMVQRFDKKLATMGIGKSVYTTRGGDTFTTLDEPHRPAPANHAAYQEELKKGLQAVLSGWKPENINDLAHRIADSQQAYGLDITTLDQTTLARETCEKVRKAAEQYDTETRFNGTTPGDALTIYSLAALGNEQGENTDKQKAAYNSVIYKRTLDQFATTLRRDHQAEDLTPLIKEVLQEEFSGQEFASICASPQHSTPLKQKLELAYQIVQERGFTQTNDAEEIKQLFKQAVGHYRTATSGIEVEEVQPPSTFTSRQGQQDPQQQQQQYSQQRQYSQQQQSSTRSINSSGQGYPTFDNNMDIHDEKARLKMLDEELTRKKSKRPKAWISSENKTNIALTWGVGLLIGCIGGPIGVLVAACVLAVGTAAVAGYDKQRKKSFDKEREGQLAERNRLAADIKEKESPSKGVDVEEVRGNGSHVPSAPIVKQNQIPPHVQQQATAAGSGLNGVNHGGAPATPSQPFATNAKRQNTSANQGGGPSNW